MFKAENEAVALALGGDDPVSKVALDLGLHQQIFGNWMRKAINESKSKNRFLNFGWLVDR